MRRKKTHAEFFFNHLNAKITFLAEETYKSIGLDLTSELQFPLVYQKLLQLRLILEFITKIPFLTPYLRMPLSDLDSVSIWLYPAKSLITTLKF